MKSTVVIKSNKSGMTVILAPEVPFEQLLRDIAVKFEDSTRFWGAVQMTLTLAGRPLTPEQEFQIANVIMFTTTRFYPSIRLTKAGQRHNPHVMECRRYVMKCAHPVQKAD